MTTKILFKDLAVTLAVILVVDAIYLYLIKNKFSNQVFMVQREKLKVDKIAFILTYILMALMFYFLVIDSCAKSNYIKSQYLYAFLVGIFVYGVFEFTNKALFSHWQWWPTVIIDTIWGGFLFLISYVIISEIKKLYS